MNDFYKINVTALENSLNSLKIAQEEYLKEKNEFVRDSVIQRFEYTYALAVKFIQRYIELNIPNQDDINSFTFNQLIRQANEMGILKNNLENWIIYRQMRNITSHTYDEEKAEQVLSIMEDFIQEIDFLIGKIK
ncbi:MAG: nucleotidyltransferase [Cyanobacteria bacterium SIG32]|nr:nucleotidyltransferase [Cyanobacteria bacterium SIG32]